MITHVFDYFVAAGQTEKAISLAADRYSAMLSWHLRDTLERALTLVPAGSQEHVLLLVQTAAPRMIVDRQTDRMAVARLAEAVEFADRLNDPYAIAAARFAACMVAGWSLDVPAAIRHGQIAVAKAAESGRIYVHLSALLFLGRSYLMSGEPDKALLLFRRRLDISEKLRDPYFIGVSHLNMTATFAATGEWKLARENLGTSSVLPGRDALSMIVETQTGNFEAARRHMEAILAEEEIWYLDSNENESLFAKLHLANMEGSIPPPLPESLGLLGGNFPVGRRHVAIKRALAVADAQDRTRAAAAYALLAPHKGIMGYYSLASTDRTLGRLAVLEGDFQRAAQHFDDALTFLRRAGYRPELAWTCSDFSGMMLDTDPLSERAKARQLQDEALSIARDLGMKPLIERILRRREILKA
jgi:tetratricopeptide (TPR) repeat protein